MRARALFDSGAGRRGMAWLAVCVLTPLITMGPVELDGDTPAGTPAAEVMAGWERIRGDVETTTMRVIYELYVRPERNGLYTVTRYRVTRKGVGAGGESRQESEKYVWNVALGEPLRCFERGTDGAWAALEHGTTAYQGEMLTAMSVYALHREATLGH